MNPTRRLAPLLLPLLLATPLLTRPGRAQTSNSDARYAFADTTLLRDTLGLSFPRLFPLSDSLHELPDTLRALSIRYRWPLARLVKLSDSLGVPVDSVGPIMERERYNPLANQASTNAISYTSTYNVGQQLYSWDNTLQYTYSRGGFFITNNTHIFSQHTQTGGVTNRHTENNSVTNLSWRIQRNLSAGVSANLQGIGDHTPGGLNNIANNANNFGLTLNSIQTPARGLTTKLNFIGGVVDANQVNQLKRGLSGEMNGQARYVRGAWLTNDLIGRLAGNVANLGVPFVDDGIPGPDAVRTHDLSTDLRGVLGLWANAPVGFNLNYRLSDQKVATAGSVITDTTTVPKPGRQFIEVQDVNTLNNSVDGTLRFRQDSGRYLNLTGNLGSSASATAGAVSSLKTLDNSGVGANGNYEIGHWVLQGNFSIIRSISAFPRFAPTGGYQENQEANSLSGSATWNATQRFNVQFLASIGLTSFRYETIGTYLTTPVAHDQYNQSYTVWPSLTISDALSTNVRLDVQRNEFINIPATSTASNNEGHNYHATWAWSFKMFEGLTVQQNNQLGANYTFYPFVPSTNRVALTYSSSTTLNAVLNPRLNLVVNQNVQSQPSGNYVPQIPGDPTEYFSRSDEDKTRSLLVTLSYAPVHTFSFSITPQYLAIDRFTTVNGVFAPQRQSRSLTLNGGAHLNVPVAKGCTLTGDMTRTYRGNRSTSFGLTGAATSPLSQSDYWVGTLFLTWTP